MTKKKVIVSYRMVFTLDDKFLRNTPSFHEDELEEHIKRAAYLLTKDIDLPTSEILEKEIEINIQKD